MYMGIVHLAVPLKLVQLGYKYICMCICRNTTAETVFDGRYANAARLMLNCL